MNTKAEKRMRGGSKQSMTRAFLVLVILICILAGLWIPFSLGRVLMGIAPWGPRIGGRLPDGTEVYFQSRPGGFETDDRLTVVAANKMPEHHWVDRVHAGFEYVVLKTNKTGHQVWVESDGKVGSSIDLSTGDFRAEDDPQHLWARIGTGMKLDSGYTITVFSVLRPW